jgi:hypothetical protein
MCWVRFVLRRRSYSQPQPHSAPPRPAPPPHPPPSQVLGAFRPALLLVEYNAKFPPPLLMASVYHPDYDPSRR